MSIIKKKCELGLKIFKDIYPRKKKNVVIVGGVASNIFLKKEFKKFTDINNANLYVPKRELCTDNAAMIAWAGAERYKKNKRNNFNFQPLPHWDI